MAKKLISATEFCLLTFTSTHHALKAEKRLEEGCKVDVLIVPTPREISSSCGLSIKFFCLDKSVITDFLKEENIPTDNIYEFKAYKSKDHLSKIISSEC